MRRFTLVVALMLAAARIPAAAQEPRDTVPPPRTAESAALRQLFGSNTDLWVRLLGRAELGGNWSRYRPCLNALQDACNPSVLPQLTPNLSFSVQLGGTIAQRLHVDADFDQSDPFEANNRINIVYDAGASSRVSRLELGDVEFPLPASRFLTEGIPRDNFGFKATGHLGPMQLGAVWAGQKGLVSQKVFRPSTSGLGRVFVQTDTLLLDDADYVKGQFFFLVDPALIPDYPHVDVLSLDGSEVAPQFAPGNEPIQLYRYENQPVLRQQVDGLIQADATLGKDGDEVTESGWFRYLQPGVDYFIHSSGLWFALRTPLRRDEMLAVTYFTATGEKVGDYNPEQLYNTNRRPRLRLLKASAANHQPGRPTWDMEMHQVYRVSGSRDVERASVGVTISLGELSAGRTFARGATGDVTFLRLFGLDQEPPLDEVDPAYVYEPGRDILQDLAFSAQGLVLDQPAVQGTFLVFPTLRPFAEPPPLRGLGLDEEDTRALLGGDANRRIYEDADPFERDNGGRFRLTIPFRVQSDSVISSFALGALGIREGSERILLEDRQLTRGEDYEIDYDLGQVTLLAPEILFAANPDAAIKAVWEQRQIFQEAPTSVFALSGTTPLGMNGVLNVLGLFQTERTLSVRPTLGVEPGAIGVGGLSGRYAHELPFLDRLLRGIRGMAPSSLSIEGEVVGSLPNPNTRGDVFLDDFDALQDRPLSLLFYDWMRGSAPTSTEGAETSLPPVLDESTLARTTTWQSGWIIEAPNGDSTGIREGFFPKGEIDKQIRVSGTEAREPGMLLSFAAREPVDAPRWASITTTLSPAGTDLTKSEFIEFYALGGSDLTLVVDLGDVSEDALFLDAAGRTSGMKSNGTPWGLGILDHEADPARGEVWGDEADERGVWGETCKAQRGRVYRPGDPDADCTRGDGRNESEDLNRNGLLDVREKHLRWVVRLDGTSEYLVRTRAETGTNFQLYRIPLQGQAAQIGGVFTDADMRVVKNLRLTLAGSRRQQVTIARMRIVGSRWIRRNQEGVLSGIVGDTVAGFGRVEATSVSGVTEGDSYQSPPAVLERLADPSLAITGQGIEFGEKSLAVRFQEIQPGDRAEVYSRFPQRAQSFLSYREARMWVVGRSGDWGQEQPHYFFFKVGTDPENFYLYRTRLTPPADPNRVQTLDWAPEVVVDFDQWLRLRQQAEIQLGLSPRFPGAPPVMIWSADSTYAVVLGDRGRAPDLANVREMSFGVWNQGPAPIRGEFWVDELRLARGVTSGGLGAHLDVGVHAGDLLEVHGTLLERTAFFRQLKETASYQGDQLLRVTSTLHLERAAPASWGVELPLTVTVDRFTQDPVFLSRSDLRADRLPDLRETGDRQTRVALGFARKPDAVGGGVGALLDGLSGSVGWFDLSSSTVTARQESQGVDARLAYSLQVRRRDVLLIPTFLEPVVRFLLPSTLEEQLLDSRLRWSPERISLVTSYRNQKTEITRYDQIVDRFEDLFVIPTHAPRESLEGTGQVVLHPLDALTADVSLLAVRDLLDPRDASVNPFVRDLIRGETSSILGLGLGWETQRVVRSHVRFSPNIVPWLTNSFDWTTRFLADRNTSFLGRRVVGADTTLLLLSNVSGDRTAEATLSARPEILSPDHLSFLLPISVAWRGGLNSRFNRGAVDPGLDYQLGFGTREDFRLIDADTAAMVGDRGAWRVNGGLRVAPGFTVESTWSLADALVLDARSDRTLRDETFPDVRARIDAPAPGPLARVLDRVSLSSGFVATERKVELGGRSQQRRTVLERTVPMDATLTWRTGTVVRYSGRLQRGEGRDPTGGTQRDFTSHAVRVRGALMPWFGPLSTLEDPLQVELIVSYVADRQCRATVRRLECVPFFDQLSRSVGLELGTVVRGFDVGVQSTYTDRSTFVGQRAGSTGFQLVLFGQLRFAAGEIPGR